MKIEDLASLVRETNPWVVPASLLHDGIKFINPTGRFKSQPPATPGLTGRKIIVDTTAASVPRRRRVPARPVQWTVPPLI